MISPELALVDPETRALGIALLEQQLFVPAGSPRVATAARIELRSEARPTRRVVAVGAYAAAAAIRMLLLDAVFVLVLGLVVFALALYG